MEGSGPVEKTKNLTLDAKTYATDIVLTAYWTRVRVVPIKYEGMTGASYVDNKEAPKMHTLGTETSIPDAQKEGYTFKGWTGTDVPQDEASKGKVIQAIYSEAQDVVLTAHWEGKPYGISYRYKDFYSGDVLPNDDAPSESSITLKDAPETRIFGTETPIPKPGRKNYTFAGWLIQSKDKDRKLQTSDTPVTDLVIGAEEYAQDITLISTWTPDIYSIQYAGVDQNEALWPKAGVVEFGALKPDRHRYDDETKVTDPVRTGYRFLGWTITDETPDPDEDEEDPGSSTSVEKNPMIDGQMKSLQSTGLTGRFCGTITLTANWEKEVYDITYDPNGGALRDTDQGKTTKTVKKGYSDPLQLIGFTEDTIPTRDGYTFAGWSTIQLTDEAVDREDNYSPRAEYTADAQILTEEGTKTLYAVWEKNVKLSGNVTFDYTYKDAFDGTEQYAEGAAAVTKLKLTVNRYVYQAAADQWILDPSWKPSTGSNDKLVTVTKQPDGKRAEGPYDFGDGYPRVEGGRQYQYRITAEPVKDYIMTEKINGVQGGMDFVLKYEPQKFETELTLNVNQGRADADCIPSKVQVEIRYRTEDEQVWKPFTGLGINGTNGTVELDFDDSSSAFTHTYLLPRADRTGKKLYYDYQLMAYGYDVTDGAGITTTKWYTYASDKDGYFCGDVKLEVAEHVHMACSELTDYAHYEENHSKAALTGMINLLDKKNPEVEVKVALDTWREVLHTVTFGKFFAERQKVTIQAADTNLKAVYYYIAEKELIKDEIKALPAADWKQIENDGSFYIDPDRSYIIYAKAVDEDGNTGYAASNGLVLDGTHPVVTGVTDGEKYCLDQIFRVTDPYLEKVTLMKDGDDEHADVLVNNGTETTTGLNLVKKSVEGYSV